MTIYRYADQMDELDEKGYFIMEDGRKSSEVPYPMIKMVGEIYKKQKKNKLVAPPIKHEPGAHFRRDPPKSIINPRVKK